MLSPTLHGLTSLTMPHEATCLPVLQRSSSVFSAFRQRESGITPLSSLGRSMPVVEPIPSLRAMLWITAPWALARSPASKKYVSEETFSACTRPTAPKSALPALQNGSVLTEMHCPAPSPSEGEMMPASSVAIAVIGLNV